MLSANDPLDALLTESSNMPCNLMWTGRDLHDNSFRPSAASYSANDSFLLRGMRQADDLTEPRELPLGKGVDISTAPSAG